MANFIISISEQIVTPYTGASDNVTEESCNTETLDYNIQMYYTNPEAAYTGDDVFIFNSYSGNPWKTLTISNIVYNNESEFYLEYQGSPLLINTEYNIDVLALSPGSVIPGLIVKNNITSGSLSPALITYDVKVTDNGDITYESVQSEIARLLTSCTLPTEPIVSDVTDIILPPTETIEFTVTHIPYSSLNFTYTTFQKSTGGFSGSVYRLDGPHGNNVKRVTLISNTVGTTFSVIDDLDVTGIAYYRFSVTTNPPNPPGPESDSFSEVLLQLRNNDNSSALEFFNILIGETTAP